MMSTEPLRISKPGLPVGSQWMFVALLVSCALFWGLTTAFVGGIFASLLFMIIAAGALVFVDHRFGIYLLAFLLPLVDTSLDAHEMFGLKGANPFNLLLIGTFFAFTISYAWEKRELEPVSRWFWLYALALIVAGIIGSRHVNEIPSVLHLTGAISFNSAAGYLRDYLAKPLLVLLVSFMVSQAVSRGMGALRLVVMVTLGFWILAIAIFLYLGVHGFSLSLLASSGARRVLSVFGIFSNDIAQALNLSLAVLLFTWAELPNGSKTKLFFLASLIVLTAAMLLTFSRGGFLAFAVLCAYFLVTRRRIRTLIASIIVLVVALTLLPAAFLHRAATGISSGNLSTISAGRINHIWIPLIPELWRHPLFGNGLSSIMWSHAIRTGSILAVTLPHNAYLGVGLDFGLIGGTVVMTFFFSLWRDFGQLCRRESDAVMKGLLQGGRAALLVLAVEGLADSRFTPSASQAMLWVMVGILYGRGALLSHRILPSPDAVTMEPVGH